MAKSKPSPKHTRSAARDAARSGKAVRDRVRDISTRAFSGGPVSGRELSKLVHDVLGGAAEVVDASIPKRSGNVLRQVFDGLSDGWRSVAAAGAATASDLGERGRTVMEKDMPAAAKHLRKANEEFLGAVETFADRASKHVRDELNTLVDRARKTGPKVTASARSAAAAADDRWGELATESARAGARVAQRGANAIAMGASGLLEGFANAVGSGPSAGSSRRSRSSSSSSPAKKKKKTGARQPASKKKAPRRRKA